MSDQWAVGSGQGGDSATRGDGMKRYEMMLQEAYDELLPGERQVWDDASVNVGVVVPWSRGGDACSDRFGVRVARFQLLLGIDCATDFVCGYGYVMRGNDAYNGGDVVRAMHGAWSLTGKAPREVER